MCRTYGACDSCALSTQALRAWAKLCRAYGALLMQGRRTRDAEEGGGAEFLSGMPGIFDRASLSGALPPAAGRQNDRSSGGADDGGNADGGACERKSTDRSVCATKNEEGQGKNYLARSGSEKRMGMPKFEPPKPFRMA